MKYLLSCLLIILPTSIGSQAKLVTLEDTMSAVEKKHGLPHGLLNAIAFVESRHNCKAFVAHDGRSKKSSYGLLQVQLGSARHVGFKGHARELMHPQINLEYGAAYLKLMLKQNKNDIARALTCYNAGPGSALCKSKKYSNYVGLVLNALVRQNTGQKLSNR